MWSSAESRGVGRHKRANQGFSMIELLVVVSIILVIAAIATPNFMTAIANVRLRGSASSVAGLMQEARLRAVRDNKYYSVRTSSVNQAYLDLSGDGSFQSGGATPEPTVQLSGVTQFTTGTPPGDLATGTYGLANSQTITSGLIATFNSRGLPCVVIASVCKQLDASSNPVSFVYYMTDQRPTQGWAAVSVSPAGRIKAWYWDGGKWEQR